MQQPVVMHLVDTLGRGGAEVLMANVVPALEGFQHVVVYLHQPADLAGAFGKWPVIGLDAQPKRNNLKIILKMRRLVRQYGVSIIHTHSYWSAIYARLAVGRQVKVVHTYHFADYTTRKHLASTQRWLALDKLTYHPRYRLLAVSEYVADMLRQECRFKNVEVLYNFVSLEGEALPAVREWHPGQPLRILAVGSAKDEKNYQLLVDAFVGMTHWPVSLDVYGDGPLLKDLCQQVQDQNLLNLQFKGLHSQVSELYPAYDLFVMCSYSEACPLAPIEAMSAGLPLLLSDIAPLREVGGDSAIYFENRNPAAFRQTVRAILEGKTTLKLDKHGYHIQLQRYSRKAHLEQLSTLYRQLLNRFLNNT